MFGLRLPDRHFPSMIQYNMRTCRSRFIFHTTASFPHRRNVRSLLLFYRFFFMEPVQKIILAPPFHTFTTRNSHSPSTESSYTHFLRIPFLDGKSYSDIFPGSKLLCRTNYRSDVSLDSTILTFSSHGSVAIYSPYFF